jgi:hypothetical protein
MELSVRASYVGGLMDTLAVPVARTAPRRVVTRASGSWAWTGAAVALAAGLAVAAMLIPRREPVRQVLVAPPPRTAIAQPPPVEVPVVTPPSRAVAVSTAAKRRRVKQADPFIALDDEPIESGIVMRVELPGSTPADIIFSPDGRARAVRLVSATQRNY